MSNFTEVEVELKDFNAIKSALIEMGFKEDQIEYHKNPTTLYGYGGQQRKANLIVRKQHAKGHSDLGFVQNANGTISVVTDTDDKYSKRNWINQLQDEYALATVKQQLVNTGYFIENVSRQNGQIEVTLDNPYA